jgi:YhcH/YjgK/YiaL family protein
MIIDKRENYKLYGHSETLDKVFGFLDSLNFESEEKRYEIEGDDIFAIVMQYETTSQDQALLESHQKYIDIQSVLVGSECFACHFTDDLIVSTPYDKAKDVTFYEKGTSTPTKVIVTPERFVLLYPHDAHMAGLMVADKKENVKKVVVKVKASLLHQKYK